MKNVINKINKAGQKERNYYKKFKLEIDDKYVKSQYKNIK